MNYQLEFNPGWDEHWNDIDNSIKLHIMKKLEQMKAKEDGRHLEHGLPYFVEQVGQYRITYKTIEERSARRIYFVGDHKQYEEWLKEQNRFI